MEEWTELGAEEILHWGGLLWHGTWRIIFTHLTWCFFKKKFGCIQLKAHRKQINNWREEKLQIWSVTRISLAQCDQNPWAVLPAWLCLFPKQWGQWQLQLWLSHPRPALLFQGKAHTSNAHRWAFPQYHPFRAQASQPAAQLPKATPSSSHHLGFNPGHFLLGWLWHSLKVRVSRDDTHQRLPCPQPSVVWLQISGVPECSGTSVCSTQETENQPSSCSRGGSTRAEGAPTLGLLENWASL